MCLDLSAAARRCAESQNLEGRSPHLVLLCMIDYDCGCLRVYVGYHTGNEALSCSNRVFLNHWPIRNRSCMPNFDHIILRFFQCLNSDNVAHKRISISKWKPCIWDVRGNIFSMGHLPIVTRWAVYERVFAWPQALWTLMYHLTICKSIQSHGTSSCIPRKRAVH